MITRVGLPGKAHRRRMSRHFNINDTERIVFSSTVSSKWRTIVEALFFFNSRQSSLHAAISSTIARTGIPRLIERDRRLWIDVPERSLQCLFACDRLSKSRVVGVVLFERPVFDTLVVLHLAVDPACTSRSSDNETGLGWTMVCKVAQIARSIKGITRVQLPYREDCFLRVAQLAQAAR
jgi:hypothetical protein